MSLKYLGLIAAFGLIGCGGETYTEVAFVRA